VNFLKHYVTACSSFGGDTPERRANKLWEAIFEQPEVESQLLGCGNGKLGRLHREPLRRRIEEEMEGLISGRLGKFEAKVPVEQLQLDTIVADVQRQAPTLWGFLVELVQQRSYATTRDIRPHNSSLFMACAILINVRAPKASYRFQAALGVHLYNMGVKRRVITLLHGLGVTISYPMLNNIRKDLEEVCRVCNSTVEVLDKGASVTAGRRWSRW
jgi:hypothetical protein